MKLVVGLGNPGPRYASTRHNAGFRVLDRFAAEHALALSAQRFSGLYAQGQIGREDVALLQPHTYMNQSGESVAEAVEALEIDRPDRDLIVVYDDMDLPLGRIRLRKSGGPGGQNGIGDVIECLGTRSVPRLRFGIGRPPADQDPIDYVLSGFASHEIAPVAASVEQASAALRTFVEEGMDEAMNRFNLSAEADCPDIF